MNPLVILRHWTLEHLWSNLAATAIVIVWGYAARLTWRHALAWLLGWPVLTVVLSIWPGHACTAGMSGLNSCGIAMGAARLLCDPTGVSRLERTGGLVVTLGLLVKTALEILDPQALPSADVHAHRTVIVDAHAHIVGIVAGALAAVLLAKRATARHSRT